MSGFVQVVGHGSFLSLEDKGLLETLKAFQFTLETLCDGKHSKI